MNQQQYLPPKGCQQILITVRSPMHMIIIQGIQCELSSQMALPSDVPTDSTEFPALVLEPPVLNIVVFSSSKTPGSTQERLLSCNGSTMPYHTVPVPSCSILCSTHSVDPPHLHRPVSPSSICILIASVPVALCSTILYRFHHVLQCCTYSTMFHHVCPVFYTLDVVCPRCLNSMVLVLVS